jgi:hypothetical protein
MHSVVSTFQDPFENLEGTSATDFPPQNHGSRDESSEDQTDERSEDQTLLLRPHSRMRKLGFEEEKQCWL